MLKLIKQFLEQLENFIDSNLDPPEVKESPKSNPVTPNQVNLQIPTDDQSKFMSKTPDLLGSITEIMNDDFCVLNISDSLSDALAIIRTQEVTDIFIVDDNGKFIGSINDISIVSKVPPPIAEVPVRYQLKEPSLRKQISDNLIEIAKMPIKDIVKIQKHPQLFSTVGYMIYALEKLADPYRIYDEPKIIPVLNKDETIAGAISHQSVLQYIRNDPIWEETKVEALLKLKRPISEVYTLSPKDTLDKASFAMEYLPIDYIPICDPHTNKLLGIVERNQISSLMNSLYFHLVNVSLGELMKPLETLNLVEYGQSLKSVMDRFLDLNNQVIFLLDSLANKGQTRLIITPVSPIQFYLHNFRKNHK